MSDYPRTVSGVLLEQLANGLVGRESLNGPAEQEPCDRDHGSHSAGGIPDDFCEVHNDPELCVGKAPPLLLLRSDDS